MPQVHEHLPDQRRPCTSFWKQDIIDEEYCIYQHCINAHPKALLFTKYTDDFKIVIPTISHGKKHKIIAFYWILLNIPLECRSRLSAISQIDISAEYAQ